LSSVLSVLRARASSSIIIACILFISQITISLTCCDQNYLFTFFLRKKDHERPVWIHQS
jgi:hypothetical protein